MKILKNVKVLKERIEEFNKIKVLDTYDILVDLPIACVDDDKEYINPVVFGAYKGIPTLMEYSELITRTKLFHLNIEEKGNLVEVFDIKDQNEKTIHVRLPKDTPVDKLIFQSGEVLLADY